MTYKLTTIGDRTAIKCETTGMWFAGYDPMGGADWTDISTEAYWTELTDAESIRVDLIAADDDEDEECEKVTKINQAERVQEALKISSTGVYQKAHDNVLTSEEQKGLATVTINRKELELLLSMVSDKITKEHETWFEITHDEAIPVSSMAYELAGSALREDRLNRLRDKLRDTLRA